MPLCSGILLAVRVLFTSTLCRRCLAPHRAFPVLQAVGKAEEEGIAATRSQGDSPGPMMMVDDETGDASVIASTAKGSQRGDTPPRGAQAPGKVRQGNWGQGELAKAGTGEGTPSSRP